MRGWEKIATSGASFPFLPVKALLLLLMLPYALTVRAAEPPPNVVLIFADDLAYADLGCFGAKAQKTPNLDRLAREGARLTDFYVSTPVCTASRAALLTGCYHERVGLRGAVGPSSKIGLHHSETTIAEMLKARGYATGMSGKWHLGSHPSQMPVHHGFDEFLGLPYSADMWPHHPENPKNYPPLPLYEGDRVIDAEITPEEQKTLTQRFAERGVDFIRRNKERPFFFYFAPNQPHVPLFVSDEFAGRSGAYADVIEEIDAAVGKILAALDETGTAQRTLIMFTSDNGPWLSYGNHAGSAGPLREGKGTCYEGGIREPFVARWPAKIPAGTVSHEPLATIDLLPTIAAITGAKLPENRIDGRDIRPQLFGQKDAPPAHDALFFYYADGQLQAMRSGPWKLLFPHTARTMEGQAPGKDGLPGKYRPLKVGLELYDLNADLGETKNLAETKPEIIRELQAKADVMRADLGDSLQKIPATGVRPAGKIP